MDCKEEQALILFMNVTEDTTRISLKFGVKPDARERVRGRIRTEHY